MVQHLTSSRFHFLELLLLLSEVLFGLLGVGLGVLQPRLDPSLDRPGLLFVAVSVADADAAADGRVRISGRWGRWCRSA